MRDIKVSQRPRSTYGVHPGVVSRIGQNGGGAHPTLPPLSNCHSVTGAEAFTHGALAREPWKEVAIAFWVPTCAGEYLLVTVCKHFRWVEVEFVSSTSARAVIPKLNQTFASLGILACASSDNAPLFHRQDFSDFSKYLGFHHDGHQYNSKHRCRQV